jgi:hypothetical protein
VQDLTQEQATLEKRIEEKHCRANEEAEKASAAARNRPKAAVVPPSF